MRIGSLFSGAGGLDMAVEEVFGGEVIWQAEVDKAASKVLAYRFPCAPNLGDITRIDWKTVEPVDVLCGGFPCQDVSAAGKRAGIKAGTRSGLWSVFAEAIDQLRPPLVVIENVREPLLGGQVREMQSAWGKYEPAIRRWEQINGPAPSPTEPNKNGNPRLSAAFSEWMMGWPAGWVTDPDIGISRNDQLKIVGNGVCPQQAIAALRYLLTVSEVAA